MNASALPPGSDLVYYPDSEPGIRRERRGRGFSYIDPAGKRLAGSDRDRVEALAVPPAYSDVWISPLPNGHLLATGRDDKGRKQYRYHPDWTAHRAEQKYADLPAVGRGLPRVRRWITEALRGEIGAFETALAATLALIDRASLRVGHPDYTEMNGSHGATTLEPRHIDTDGGHLSLEFLAKGGAEVEKSIYAPRLATVLEDCQDLPGATVITWLDKDGTAYGIRSDQVNAKLADLCDAGVTAKSLRTWNGTHAAFLVATEDTDDPLTISRMADAAAERLHNTPAIARDSYIHPKVVALTEMSVDDRMALLDAAPDIDELRKGEAALCAFLDS